MLKKILSYGLVEGIAKGLNKLIILVIPFFLIDVESFGKIGLIISIEIILPFLTLLGLERAVLRFYSKKNEIPDFRQTTIASVSYAHLIIFLLFYFLYLIGFDGLFEITIYPDILLTIILVYFQGINLINLNIYRVSEKHKKYFKNRLFLQISKFILVILLIVLTDSYRGYLYGGIIAAFFTNLIFNVNFKIKFAVFNKKSFLYLFGFSWPFIVHGVSLNLLGNADKFIIAKFLNLNQVGLYTFAYSFASIIVFAFLGITVYIEPLIYKEQDSEKREKFLNNFLILALLIGLGTMFVITASKDYLLPVFYNQELSEGFYIIPLLSSAFLLQPFYLKANYKMIYEKKTLKIAIISVFCCLFNIILNFIFIPKYGVLAAVYLTFISNFLQYCIFVLLANKLKVKGDFIELVVLGICIWTVIYFRLNIYFISMPFAIYFIYFMKIKHKFKNE